MKHKHIFRALNLVFIGIILLFINFNLIHFRWAYFSIIPAAVLIYFGLSLIFNYFGDKKWAFAGKLISFVAIWGLVLVQLSPYRFETSWSRNFWFSYENDIDQFSDDDNDNLPKIAQNLTIPDADTTEQHQCLEIIGGAVSINLSDTTGNLIHAKIEGSGKNVMYSLFKKKIDSTSVIIFEPKKFDKKIKKSISGFNKIDINLNAGKLWDIKAIGGVGDFDFELSKFKIGYLKFDGGASNLKVKLGNLNPRTDVKINSGVASIKFEIPVNSACEIKVESALSSTDFKGFTKVSENTFRIGDFEQAFHKIYIEYDGALSSFKVVRY